jgi:hypothetical protein
MQAVPEKQEIVRRATAVTSSQDLPKVTTATLPGTDLGATLREHPDNKGELCPEQETRRKPYDSGRNRRVFFST